MRIGIDIDGVLADFITPIMEFHNAHYRTTFGYSDVINHDLSRIWNKPTLESNQIIRDFFDTPHFDALRPIDGARGGILSLREKHELVVITHRSPEVGERTLRWLDAHFGNAFTTVSFGGNKEMTSHANAKLELGQKQGIDWLIEDTFPIAHECAENGMKVLLFNHPWNAKSPEHSNIVRVHSWDEIVKRLNE